MKRFFCSINILLVCLALASVATAQKKDYKPGEKVECKMSYTEDKWEECTFVAPSKYDGSQPIVKLKPEKYYPPGVESAEQALQNWDWIRPLSAKKISSQTKTKTEETNGDKPEPQTNVNAGNGLMTKEEILGYMRANGYVNGHPKKDPQVCKDLIEQIKQRGVKEPFKVGKDDLSPIYENGCGTFDTDVAEAVSYNLGTPTTVDWLTGTWIMYVIGGTVDTRPGDGYIYRKNESIAKLGFITINADGTYVWKVDPADPPAKYVKGKWRNATREEMKLQGGAGIVLQKAAEGRDWIAYKYMDEFNKAERIDVQDLQYRGAHRRIGWRK